ncbi:MAG: alanine--tRNA ligase [Candidatus Omnitrophica bacterium]|nr:alanine--tRNA ligase [Candidatus Omnitrophota bacterium]
MNSHDLRSRFLKFFERHGHAVQPSDSLIPSGDPTVLFTSAGMNQFKDYFLGKRTDLTRAASCQKCLRTGDLDKVGKSPSHHSFFEMLGNFSFGDYFKREAIGWAWEFLTSTKDFAGNTRSDTPELCLSLPASKLWVSIYQDDNEAHTLWRELGVPEERIKRFGQADNFWPANAPSQGPNGPCGPCSEIYYDADGQVAGPRSLEVWNLVFTQYDRQPDGALKPLPKPNIDTGMGLERLARVLQQVETDYETDLFAGIVNSVRQLPRCAKATSEQAAFAERAIADHLRAIVFLIADGVRPSNESRGYVLRMLIRRASRLGRVALGVDAGPSNVFVGRLVDAVLASMAGSPYRQELAEKRPVIIQAVDQEEAQFVETLESGTSRLDALLETLAAGKTRVIPGEEAFKLYDTYGFPLELTEDIAQERGFTVERDGFANALKAQQERSRKASQFGGDIFTPTTLKLEGHAGSEFVGYQSLEAVGRIQGIWKQDGWVQEARAGDEVGLVLDRSPFYGESGGQIGDRGVLELLKGSAEVVTVTWADALLVHHVKITAGVCRVNEPVKAKVDPAHRLKVARSHTATHLLHWALRRVLGPEAVQAGSLVEAERLRFDFSALGGLQEEQQLQVEQLVNERIRLADAVQTQVMKLAEARQRGAVALFGEKYGQEVRVVSIGDYSQELCGGTHLLHTGFVGTFKIVSEGSVAAGTRRIEAMVGEAAFLRQQQESQWLRHAAAQLNRPAHEVAAGLDELLQQIKASERAVKEAKLSTASSQAKGLLEQAKQIDGLTFIGAAIGGGADRELLSALADALKGSMRDGVAVLASADSRGRVAWVMAATAGAVTRGVHAGKVLKEVAALTGGSGGGRPEFAQAGGSEPGKVAEALARAEALVRQAVGR